MKIREIGIRFFAQVFTRVRVRWQRANDISMPEKALEHMVLALKVLRVCYGIGDPKIDPVDIEILKSYLGDDLAIGLAADQIACLVIERELEKLKSAGVVQRPKRYP